MRSMRAMVAIAATGCALVLSVAACGSSGGSQKAALATGGTLTYLLPGDPGTLNPLKAQNGTSWDIDYFAYDRILNLGPDGGIQSGLATKWSQRGNTYRFTLRPGVTCSDGSPLTASTVAANINYIANPKNADPYLVTYVPPGATAVGNDATSSLTITLGKAFPFFFFGLTQVPIVCAKGLADQSVLAGGSDGSGPFVLSSAVPGQTYTFSVRRGYDWGPAGASTSTAGTPGRIVMKVVTDPTTAASLLSTGEANIAEVTGLASKPLTAAGLYSVNNDMPLGELWFNQAPGHLGASELVRRALTMALDLPQLGHVIGQGMGIPSTGLVVVRPGLCSGNTVEGNLPGYDPREAAKLLDQAGWKMGPGGVRTKGGRPLVLTLLYDTDAGGDPGSAFELAAQEWAKLGVKVNLVSGTATTELATLFGSGSWDIVDIQGSAGTPSQMVSYVSGPAAPQGKNFAHIDNAGYNSLAAAAAAKPGTTGCPQWNQAEADLFKAADVVPFESQVSPIWGSKVRFTAPDGVVSPTSLRLED